MRIGILTFWESQDNYGQQLQAFALQTYLQNMGNEVFLIKYRRIASVQHRTLTERIKNFNLKKFLEARFPSLKSRTDSKPKIDRHFDSFRKTHINFSDITYDSLEELNANPPKADVYICGSDQVWNNSFSVSCEAFLLGFGDATTKRIAYAASFGMKELPLETEQLFNEHIHNFDAVGVREKSGLNICKTLGYPSAIWVPDPTMLFKKQDWLNLFPNGKAEEKKADKRLFLYTLGNSPINERESYIDFANNLEDVEVFHVSANNDFSGNAYPSIPDWIHTLSDADFVITNSFHGTLFSILFNKNFVVLPNTGSKAGMNERVISLLEKVGLSGRISHEFDEKNLNSLLFDRIDWREVNGKIENWKSKTDDFFKILTR
ncbi:polysaccharide pyruvyl transferase family protein [Pareuzebyella sediminis]|uniref:polysaccharide pyruvyl transferase family protein n=1 Tax=Pareuzebyella sediminis TaxID=2607998 RepID=UPI0011EDD158|nr:polysaccharide pyruvyl transferase family protein [Pareuzebyella sediminis]